MASHPNFVKKQIAVDTVTWTPVVSPVDCMSFSIKNSVLADLKLRTDSADPATQDTISAGALEAILAPQHAHRIADEGKATRFLAGDTVAFLQAASGTGPALVTFVR